MINYNCIREINARVCYRKVNKHSEIDKSIFTSKELKLFESFKNEKRRLIFYFIRLMARNEGIVEIVYDNNGKPVIDDHNISITHSGDWVGFMISKSPIGLDIESDNVRILKIKDRFLDRNEQELICKNEIKKMSLCWSAKEAVFKMVGGETTFFKSNQRVLELNEENISVEYFNNLNNGIINMKIKTLDDNFHLVYTM